VSRKQREELMRHGDGDNEEGRHKRQGGNRHGGRASSSRHPVGAAGIAIVLEREHRVQVYVDVVQAVTLLPLRLR
jgi:hypothetical protein